MKLRKPKLPDPKRNAKANAAGGARPTLGGQLDEVVVTAKKDKKKAKVDVCKKKGKVNELHCKYKNKKITQSSYLRKLRRLKGQKKEKVNTRTYTYKTNE